MLDLYERFGYAPRELQVATSAFLDSTDDLYRRHVDRQLRRRVGVALDAAAPPDLARLWRAPGSTGVRAGAGLAGAAGNPGRAGIDLDAQPNVELDIEARAGKVPRAFCAPVRVPGRVILVLLPRAGRTTIAPCFTRPATPSTSPTCRRSCRPRNVCSATTPSPRALRSCSSICCTTLMAGGTDGDGAAQYTSFSALSKLFLVRRYAAKLA